MNDRRAYFLGSFAPLHAGHLSIVNHYEKNFGNEVTFVISRNNIDKGEVSDHSLKQRILQFEDLNRKYAIVNARTFLGSIYEIKSKQFFDLPVDVLVGADTWNRILEPRCYFDSKEETERVLGQLSKLVRFIVFPRDDIDTLIDKRLNRVLISKDDFESLSISSTQIRESK